MKRFFLATFLGLCAFGLSGCQILLDTYVYFYGFSEDRSLTHLAGLSSQTFDHLQESDTSGGLSFVEGDLTIRVPEAALAQQGVWSASYQQFQTSEEVYYPVSEPNAAVPTIRSTRVLRIHCENALTRGQTYYPPSTQGNFYYNEIACPKAPNVFLGIRVKTPEKWGGDIHYQLSVLIKNKAGKMVEVGSSSPSPRDDWETTRAH